MFGRLVFALCCNNISAASPPHFQKSLEMIGRLYSADVKNVALFLISKGGPHRVTFFWFLWGRLWLMELWCRTLTSCLI